MEANIAELTGAALDRLVARADGWTRDAEDRSGWWKAGQVVSISAKGVSVGFGFRPSSNWADGGPIIERECIEVGYMGSGHGWQAALNPHGQDGWALKWLDGETPLIAAMRAFVASKAP